MLLRRSFRPEFLNRLDEIVFYKPLLKGEITAIVDLLIAELSSRMEGQKLHLRLTPAAKDAVIEGGYDPVYGARPLKRYLQRAVETPVARTIIEGNLLSGDTLIVDYVGERFTVEKE